MKRGWALGELLVLSSPQGVGAHPCGAPAEGQALQWVRGSTTALIQMPPPPIMLSSC